MQKRIIITAIILAVVHFGLLYYLAGVGVYTDLCAIDNPGSSPSAIGGVSEPLVRILTEPGESLWGPGNLANRSGAVEWTLLALNSLIWGVGLAVIFNILVVLLIK